ncbi:hypothetical protein ACJX0J_017239, partial [Zea mays]
TMFASYLQLRTVIQVLIILFPRYPNKFIWIHLIKFKSKALVKRLFNKKIIIVQSDWGGEYEVVAESPQPLYIFYKICSIKELFEVDANMILPSFEHILGMRTFFLACSQLKYFLGIQKEFVSLWAPFLLVFIHALKSASLSHVLCKISQGILNLECAATLEDATKNPNMFDRTHAIYQSYMITPQ